MSKLSFGDYAAARDGVELNEGIGDAFGVAKDMAKDAWQGIKNKVGQVSANVKHDYELRGKQGALKNAAKAIEANLMKKVDTVAKTMTSAQSSLKSAHAELMGGMRNAKAVLKDERIMGLIEPRTRSALNGIIKILANDIAGIDQTLSSADDAVDMMLRKAEDTRNKLGEILKAIAGGLDLQKLFGKLQAVEPVETPIVQPSQPRLDPRRIGKRTAV
jgi:hypothetical protein